MIPKHCDICKQNKEEKKVNLKKVGSHLYMICDKCDDEIKWTTTCMKISTDWLVKSRPDSYRKVGTIAVCPIGGRI